MNKGVVKESNGNEARLPEVESFLESTFRPVAPRPDFVRRVKTRLSDPEIRQRASVSEMYQGVMLLFAISATVLLAAGLVRLILEIVGAITIVRLASRQTGQKLSL